MEFRQFSAEFAHLELHRRSSRTPRTGRFHGGVEKISATSEMENSDLGVPELQGGVEHVRRRSSGCAAVDISNSGVGEKRCKLREKRCEVAHPELRPPSSTCPRSEKISPSSEKFSSRLQFPDSAREANCSDRKENFLARKENNSTFRANDSDVRVICSRRRAIRCNRKAPRFAIGEHFSTRREMSLALAVRGRNARLRQAKAAVRAVSGEVSAASGWGALPFVRVMAESVKAFRWSSRIPMRRSIARLHLVAACLLTACGASGGDHFLAASFDAVSKRGEQFRVPPDRGQDYEAFRKLRRCRTPLRCA